MARRGWVRMGEVVNANIRKSQVILTIFFFLAALLIVGLAAISKTQAISTTCYWVGDTAPANWNDASHWSSSSGGAGSTCDGGVVPGSDDIVVFDSANTNGVTLDISPTVASIMNTGNYSGEFNMNGNNLTVAGDFTFKGGSVLAGAGTLGVGGDFDINGTTYTYNTQAVTLTGVSSNIDAGGNTLYDLAVDGGLTIINSDMSVSHGLDVSGTLTVNSGRKLTALSSVTTTLSGTIDGEGLLELIKYACKNIGAAGTLNADVRCRPQENPSDITIPARVFGGNLELYNDTGTLQGVTLGAGDTTINGNLAINQISGRVSFSLLDTVTSLTIMGDMSFTGSPWGRFKIVGNSTVTFHGNVDMGHAVWEQGTSCYSENNVIFAGDNTSYHHAVYGGIGLGCVQTFYDLTIAGSNVSFYETDTMPEPELIAVYPKNRQGVRVVHHLTIEDGASLVIMNNPESTPYPHDSLLEDKWYNDPYTYGRISIEPTALGTVPASGLERDLKINGTGTITGEGYLSIAGNKNDLPSYTFSETDGTIDVPIAFRDYGTVNIVGRTFNKDIAFTYQSVLNSTYVFGTTAGQTFNILGDLIVDRDDTGDIQSIDASIYNPDININGNYFNDIGSNSGYLSSTKMGSGTWRVGGDFESTGYANRVEGEDATLITYGDEKRIFISAYYAETPYYNKTQGIGAISLDDSTNPNNQFYIDSRIVATKNFTIDSTSSLRLRDGIVKMWDGSTTNINGYISGEMEYLELFDDSILNFNYLSGHVNIPVRIIPYTKDVNIPDRNYDMDIEVVNRSDTPRTAVLGTAAGQTITFDNLHLSTSVFGVGDAITLDSSIYNPTINIVNNFDCRGLITIDRIITMGSSNWNVGGSVNYNYATVNSGTSTLNMTGTGKPQWQGLTTNKPTIYTQTVFDGELYAGGNFTNIDSVTNTGYIAKWNGSEWLSVGGGCSSRVYTMHVYQDELYVGGSFTSCGGVDARYIAKWDGSSWSAVGPGLNSTAMAMTLYGSNLVVGGWFTQTYDSSIAMNYIGQWDGTTWSPIGAGINNNDWGSPTTMLEYDNKLYVGGDFYTDDEIENDYFAIFDGSNWSYPGIFDQRVDALYSYNENLLIGGYFKKLQGSQCELTAYYDGTSYNCMGSSPGLTAQDNGDDYWYYNVQDFQIFQDELYVGGMFNVWQGYVNNYWGGAPSTNFAKWNGSDWEASGLNNIGTTYELGIFNEDLISVGTSASGYMLNSTINRLSASSYLISNQGGYPATKNQLYNLRVSSPSTTKVIFSDSTEITNTFYNTAANSSMEFNSGDYFHFPHLDIDGSPTPRILWRSTIEDQKHYLIQDDYCPSVYYIDVKDSDASLGEIIYSLTSIDSGSNINWDFAGSCKAAPPDDPPDDPEDDLPDDPDDDEEDDRDDSDNDEGDDLDGSGSEDDSSDQGGETSTLDDLISSLPITGPEILFTIFIIVGITCLSIVVKRTIKKYNSSKLP